MGSHTDKRELRSEFVATRLRPSELAALERLASELDRTVSALVREAIRAHVRKFTTSEEDNTDVQEA